MKPPPVSDNLIKRAPECRTEPPKGYTWTPPPFNMALPFCERDAHMAVALLEWIRDLGPVERHLTLFYDKGMDPEIVAKVKAAAAEAFQFKEKTCSSVDSVILGKSGAGWPGSNNFVWYHICRVMKSYRRPWLLLETDLAPCSKDWVSRLEDEYTRAGLPFMGSWVEYYDILNGAAVYPPDVEAWCPGFFKGNPLLTIAYDCAIAPDIVWFSHNATHLMPHIWFTRPNGRPGGLVPTLPEWNGRMVDWVCTHNAVLVHRCKDRTLIDILRKRLLN